MSNPQHEILTITSNESTLNDNIKDYHNIIICTTTKYNSTELNGNVFENYNYKIGYTFGDGENEGYYTPSTDTYRRRPYLTVNHGYNVTLQNNEYQIDFDNKKIYFASNITDALIIWDQCYVPSGVIYDYDLNPLHNHFDYNQYFLYFNE